VKILYDGYIYRIQRAGGINRYFAEIISGLPADYHPLITGVEDFGNNAPSHPNLEQRRFKLFRPRRISRRLRDKWWKPRVLDEVDLFHPTYYDLTDGFKFSDFTCPVVTTVYDMIYASGPKQIEGAETLVNAQRESVQRADRVVCISRSTEKELLHFIPEAAGKTTVIHLASSFPILAGADESVLYEKPTFLYVGYRGGYKNFLFLLRAFARAASVVNTIRLRVVGPALTSEECWQMHYLGITDRVISATYPDEAALQQLYRNSVALLYPSRHEGFGIPPLEAMSCGTIPVTADTTSLPEVVGDGGIMLDPTDEDAWADCIIKLSRPFHERANLLDQGRRRVKQFTWAECARRHVDIYRELSS
jgi:glycosyltransferase involved in cell wall biosynthesis